MNDHAAEVRTLLDPDTISAEEHDAAHASQSRVKLVGDERVQYGTAIVTDDHRVVVELESGNLYALQLTRDAAARLRADLDRHMLVELDPPNSGEGVAVRIREAAERLRPETDVELHDRLATAGLPAAEAQVVGAVKQVLGDVEVRLHKPGAGILRIIVPATVPPADADAALELLRTVVPVTVQARIELEPGKPPEGYTVNAYEANDGEAPSSPHVADGAPPTASWSLYEWHGEGLTDLAFKSEAAAVDSAWESHVEGQQPQDAADAEVDA